MGKRATFDKEYREWLRKQLAASRERLKKIERKWPFTHVVNCPTQRKGEGGSPRG